VDASLGAPEAELSRAPASAWVPAPLLLPDCMAPPLLLPEPPAGGVIWTPPDELPPLPPGGLATPPELPPPLLLLPLPLEEEPAVLSPAPLLLEDADGSDPLDPPPEAAPDAGGFTLLLHATGPIAVANTMPIRSFQHRM